MTALKPMPAEAMAGWFRKLLMPGQVVELRALECREPGRNRKENLSGFFDDIDKFVEAARNISNRSGGVYFTVNCIDPALLARANNKLKSTGQYGEVEAAGDTHVTRRTLLYIDVDPVRPSGIPASDVERAKAKECLDDLLAFLRQNGWPEPIVADSGNGWHALFRIDLPGDDGGLVERVVKSMSARFSTEGANIDKSVFNASRICRLYGVPNRKGDGTEDRPHRLAQVVSMPDAFDAVPQELMEQLVEEFLPPDPVKPAAAPKPRRKRLSNHRGGGLAPQERARKYLDATPGAISGQGGHGHTFKTACKIVRGFNLSPHEAFPFFDEWNQRTCQPPWNERELMHKLEEADAKAEGEPGYMLDDDPPHYSDEWQSAGRDEPEVNGGGASQGARSELRPIHIENAEVVDTGDEKFTTPRTMPDILDQIGTATDGWPRRANGALFVHERDVVWLEKPSQMFAYLSRKVERITFHRSAGCYSKEEAFAAHAQTCRAYDAIEKCPHEPAFPTHYYACSMPAPGNGQRLRELVGRFTPATELDRDLILSAFVTPGWGGGAGKRPAYLITSDAGRGVGKTTLGALVASLWHGRLEISSNESSEIIKQRLLSSEGLIRRVATLDNVKSHKFSWADLESLITTDTISGKRLYVGEAQRPNMLTWFITLNGASMSTDLAQRVVPIKLDRPVYSATWEDETRAFIEQHRVELWADVIKFLRDEPVQLAKFSRWGDWERDILARLPEPTEAQELIARRQSEANVEEEEADSLEDFIRSELERCG